MGRSFLNYSTFFNANANANANAYAYANANANANAYAYAYAYANAYANHSTTFNIWSPVSKYFKYLVRAHYKLFKRTAT